MTQPTSPPKPAPVPNPETRAFWEACARGELTVQRCENCNNLQHYPRVRCTSCRSDQLKQVAVSGTGTVRSYTINRVPVSAAYAPDVPYAVALVELAEGPTMMTNIVGCDPEQVHIGLPVKVTFESRGDAQLPQFTPVHTGNLTDLTS